MHYLHLSYLTSRNIKILLSVLLCAFMVGCTSTNDITQYETMENKYYHGYISENYTHTEFTTFNQKSVKRPALSDHHLLMSLLNRPMTADQAMMIAFEQERASYNPYYTNYAVEIRGDKSSDESNRRVVSVYSTLISQDLNAVSIQAPN